MRAGARVVKDNWREVTVRLDRNIKGGVLKMLAGLETQLKANVVQKHLVDTGNYLRSWTGEVGSSGLTAELGSPVEYGVYLEYGYHQKGGTLYPKKRGNTVIGWGRTSDRFMPARPHVRPAADTIAARASRYFERLDRP